jgi:hypothetical protein
LRLAYGARELVADLVASEPLPNYSGRGSAHSGSRANRGAVVLLAVLIVLPLEQALEHSVGASRRAAAPREGYILWIAIALDAPIDCYNNVINFVSTYLARECAVWLYLRSSRPSATAWA